MVLGAYYAKARMYDAADRRFMAADPVKGEITNPQSLAQYTYCLNNPIRYVDPTGKAWTQADMNVYRKLEQMDLRLVHEFFQTIVT